MKRHRQILLVTVAALASGLVAHGLTPALTTLTGTTYLMGNAANFPDGLRDEYPRHNVTLSTFRIGTYLVRWDEWQDVRNNYAVSHGYTDLATGQGRGASHPVTHISWYDAIKWCNALSERDNLTPVYSTSTGVLRTDTPADVLVNFTANGYRLPTEAEWEFAARGGVADGRFPNNLGAGPAPDPATIGHDRANYVSSGLGYDASGAGLPWTHPDGNWGAPAPGAGSAPSPGIAYTNPVNHFAPNGYGLYDMAGNIWQWCWDFYGEYYYTGLANPVSNPTGPTASSAKVPTRVLRGGSWDSTAFYARVSNRAMDIPVHRLHGFRVARKAP